MRCEMLDYQHADLLLAQSRELAEAAIALQFAHYPDLQRNCGVTGRARAVQDSVGHLQYLAASMATRCQELFDDYLRWAAVLQQAHQSPMRDVTVHCRCMQSVLSERLPHEAASVANQHIDSALEGLLPEASTEASYIERCNRPQLAGAYFDALVSTQRGRAKRLVLDALATGVGVQDLYLDVFLPCQFELGRLWQLRRLTVAQEHFCTAATQSIMSHLYQTFFDTPRNGLTAVIGCVGDELHELGARMVADFLELGGWNTLYLGANTPAHDLAAMVSERKADIVCLSTTLAIHIRSMAETIEALRVSAGDGRVPILVGGYPFQIDEQLWQKVGADGFAHDARAAIEVAESLVKRGTAQ